jgi:hypothetical protein
MKHTALFILIIALSGCKSGLKAEKEITLDQGMVAVIGERQYSSLMTAVRDAQDHDIIKIFRPVREEIVIEGKNLTLIGIGKEAIISHPSVLSNTFTSSRDERTHGIIIVRGGSVGLQNLVIDGRNAVEGNKQTVGICILDADIYVSKVHITNMTSSLLEKRSNGIAILAQNTDELPSALVIDNCIIDNFQQGGIYIYNSTIGYGFDIKISNCIINGSGGSHLVAQNGIMIAGPVSGEIVNNTISNLKYTPASMKAMAILGLDISGGKLVIDKNVFNNVDEETNIG